jgi:hypothetical protein
MDTVALMSDMPLLRTEVTDTDGEAGKRSNDTISKSGLKQNQQAAR